MIGIYGTKLFGAVDKLDEGTYVATLFHHMFGFPLVFQGTYLVLGFNGPYVVGPRIRISWKSVIFAYIRTLLFLPMLIGVLAAWVAYLDKSWGAIAFAAGAIAFSSLGFLFTYKVGLPSQKRMEALRILMAQSARP